MFILRAARTVPGGSASHRQPFHGPALGFDLLAAGVVAWMIPRERTAQPGALGVPFR